MNEDDLDKRFQLYTDSVLRRKIGQDGFERARFATALACFLLLRDLHDDRLAGDLPPALQIRPRVDTSNRDGETVRRLKTYAYKQMFERAKSDMAPRSYKAILMLFVDDARLRTIGAALGRLPDSDSNATINNAVARAHIENGAERLVRYFHTLRGAAA